MKMWTGFERFFGKVNFAYGLCMFSRSEFRDLVLETCTGAGFVLEPVGEPQENPRRSQMDV